MTARVLVVDDIDDNVRFLQARLAADYFEVLTARSGAEALEICSRERIDVMVLDVVMPGLDGIAVCHLLKSNAATAGIAVLMVSALDQPAAKVRGLEAGADDFLTRPIDQLALATRVRNLARLKTIEDEIAQRAAAFQRLGLPARRLSEPLLDAGARILLVEDRPRAARRVIELLGASHVVAHEPTADAALAAARGGTSELVLVSLGLERDDGLRLCAQIRSYEPIRHLPIVVMADPDDRPKVLVALEMGVNDYLVRPLDRHEMLARIRTQVRRRRHSESLRRRVAESIELAMRDELTGLYNLRYMRNHVRTLVAAAVASGGSLSVLMADIDGFKAINDRYGHAAGDAVLREFARRLACHTGPLDVACRLGGEEFLLLMPDADLAEACRTGEQLRSRIADASFAVGGGAGLRVTASIGAASLTGTGDTAAALLRRADEALYRAKRGGRNRLVAAFDRIRPRALRSAG